MAIKTKQLLVEGEDDKFAVIGLMEHHVPWLDRPAAPPVYIESTNGFTNLLEGSFLLTKLKESGVEALGMVVDADDNPVGRWHKFQSIFQAVIPGLPSVMPGDGLIMTTAQGVRVGLWMMPDCGSSGMLETFLQYLVPDLAADLWQHAESSFQTACSLGAPCRSAHHDKARIHTWLAWQDPPGESLGRALTRKTLDPTAPTATAFVAWFRSLFLL
jgi:hypothetical protein